MTNLIKSASDLILITHLTKVLISKTSIFSLKVFILQLEGQKHWKLYKPPIELPQDYSPDLERESIGDPTHEFDLEVRSSRYLYLQYNYMMSGLWDQLYYQ